MSERKETMSEKVGGAWFALVHGLPFFGPAWKWFALGAWVLVVRTVTFGRCARR